MNKKVIKEILKKNNVKRAGLFGSYARGDFKKDSDVDILIEINKNLSLLDIIRIKLELEAAIEKNVDLVEYSQIKPLIRESVLKEEVKLI